MRVVAAKSPLADQAVEAANNRWMGGEKGEKGDMARSWVLGCFCVLVFFFVKKVCYRTEGFGKWSLPMKKEGVTYSNMMQFEELFIAGSDLDMLGHRI